ncbi:MAG: 2-C-methyl-D-erythritol 2,4-cyclodiphosphate synthase [Candidatus Marinimicrobia bacterium]|nr:2-C-methyl-D-erythritol 2,4-cyclodiphosphate synthase [Candidatus Neomarinimicrobiota bacterium]|tara:strand:+ start:33919 stop:34398 length:480 start_codon:yes stop_codon:yes gene_type:complete
MFRTGIGYDVHRLAKGKPLILGGLEITSDLGSVGHSDGDVLSHSIVDALLGAAGLGDIGTYYPSDNDQWKDFSSLKFIAESVKRINNSGYKISNIDATIILQYPYLNDYILDIRKKLAIEMNIHLSEIAIKATTTDGLGFIGASEGIGALAIATLIFKK